jgi:hypothetical protein
VDVPNVDDATYLNRAHRRQIGAQVLVGGLPPLPGVLTYQMSIPLACWKADRCAVVLFLAFNEQGGRMWPKVTIGTYFREGDHWSPHRMWGSTGWPHDPIANPGYLRDLGGRAIVSSGGSRTVQPESGYPAAVVIGRAVPAVKQIALIQDGHEDRRPLESHFGAWVICTEQESPFRIIALDENGIVLGTID